MSNIGNQVVAVVATLLGFIAHDYLSEAKAVPAVNTGVIVAAADLDPIGTRSVEMEGLSLQSVDSTSIAPAATPKAPASSVTVRTAAVKFDHVESDLASINKMRSIGIPVETTISDREAGYIR